MSTYSELQRVLFTWYTRLMLQIFLWRGIIFEKKLLRYLLEKTWTLFLHQNGWISCFKIRHGHDDNIDEEWLHVVEDMSGVKFSGYFSIYLEVTTSGILSIKVMCDNVKNKKKSQRRGILCSS
ncbi:hypothetical protein NPIL_24001 [Nephila pilipes]|uniref:Uncharacterized protein n=1 Tax=Nephila pilipes TaxID=299642 RepID=A0A8X6MB29_NEPPI|nr:hypothetical protein NPIL_24001 [Nephila pilipes]